MQKTAASQRPTTGSLRTFFSRLRTAFLAAAGHFPAALRRYPLVTAFLILYVLLRFSVNYWHFTSRLSTALISVLMGLLMNGLIVLLIDVVHAFRFGAFTDPSVEGTAWAQGPNHKSLAVLVLFWLLWGLMIVDHNQRLGSIPGSPVLGIVPGWVGLDVITRLAAERIQFLLAGVSTGTLHSYVKSVLLLILPLLVVMRLIGYRWRDFSLNLRNGQVAVPLLVITGLIFLLNGPTLPVLIALGLALLHPGLTEELLYRGMMQRALRGWMRPGNAILLAALFFALLHFPGYFFELYGQDIWQTILNLADVMVTGLVWGYGFHRSGGLLPWVAVHALSNLAGL